MTNRERMLAVIRGEPFDRVPWAPRMDLWAIARRARGELPAGIEGADTARIADWLGVACHAVRGDRTLAVPPEDLALRGLGFENHPDHPYRLELDDVDVEIRHDHENLACSFRTGAGVVSTHLRSTAEMLGRGISIPFVLSYAIAEPADLEAVGGLFERIRVVPTPDRYAGFRMRIGDRGLAVAGGPVAGSPMHLILHELMPMDRFFYAYVDDPAGLHRLCDRMEPVFAGILEALARCDAEVLFWGGNYDQDLTWPPFFRGEIAPWLRRAADRAHAAGKHLLTHTDGENQALLPLYPACGFDVAESLCPAPMTRLPLRALREGFGEAVTVWGGVPSVALLADSMDGPAFDHWLDELAAELERDPRRIIVGVSDNVPPDADLERLARVGERVAAAGGGRRPVAQ